MNIKTSPLRCLFWIAIILLAGCCGCRKQNIANDNTINSALSSPVRTLDPIMINDVSSRIVASHIFENLYEYHYLKRPYELISQLADGEPVVSEDGLEYVIKIKQGVKFCDDKCFPGSSGRELKAQDFVYSFKRIADVHNASANWALLAGRIEGLDDFRDYTSHRSKAEQVDYNKSVSGVKAIDDYTLCFRLTKKFSGFKYVLCDIVTSPVAREAVEYYGFDIMSHPVGTGAYRLEKWHRGFFAELARNDNFRGQLYPSQGQPEDAAKGLLVDAGKDIPFADKMTFMIVPEQQPKWYLFMNGKIDVVSVSGDSFSQVVDEKGNLKKAFVDKDIVLEKYNDPSIYMLGFNMSDKLVGENQQLRKAISLCVDRDKYIRMFYNLRGQHAYGIIPPMLEGYDQQLKQYCGQDFDMSRSRTLIEQFKMSKGIDELTVQLAMPGTGSFWIQQGEFFRHCFAQAGLKVELEYYDRAGFYEKLNNGGHQIYLAGWFAKNPDCENLLGLYYGPNSEKGLNFSCYDDPEYNKLYSQALIAGEVSERIQLFQGAQKVLIDDYACVFLHHGWAYILHHSRVENYKGHSFGWGLGKYRRIAEQ